MYNFDGVFSILESDMTLILLFGDVLENTDGVVLKILIFSCNFFLSFLGETFRLLELELSSFVLRGWLCSYKKKEFIFWVMIKSSHLSSHPSSHLKMPTKIEINKILTPSNHCFYKKLTPDLEFCYKVLTPGCL